MPDNQVHHGEDSTVDDWFGQNVARDQELADELLEQEGGDESRAAERFQQEAEGEERFRAGHPRPSQR